MKLILASNNAKKLRELKAILSDMDVEILSQREAGCNFEVDETGTTFAENAYLKAKAVFDATGEAVVADDSGLMVDALTASPACTRRATLPAATTQAMRKSTCIFYPSLRA